MGAKGGALEIRITRPCVMIFPGIMGIGDGYDGLFSEMIGWELDVVLIRLMSLGELKIRKIDVKLSLR